MGLELYLDLLSQPCRSIYIFARSNNIPFEFKQVELFKGGTDAAARPPTSRPAGGGGRRAAGRLAAHRGPRAQRPSLASWQTRCWGRSRRRGAARSSPAQVRGSGGGGRPTAGTGPLRGVRPVRPGPIPGGAGCLAVARRARRGQAALGALAAPRPCNAIPGRGLSPGPGPGPGRAPGRWQGRAPRWAPTATFKAEGPVAPVPDPAARGGCVCWGGGVLLSRPPEEPLRLPGRGAEACRGAGPSALRLGSLKRVPPPPFTLLPRAAASSLGIDY